MQELVGKTLKNQYKVEKLLGRGGMAEVYLVRDLKRSVPLAMKVLREDLSEDVVFLRRFKREAQTLSKLQHPNIVRFYGLEQDKDLAFLLMEYVEGNTLRKEIFKYQKPFSQKKLLKIISPVCAALHYAHQQGLVHCDVKSANIMLSSSGNVYLADFGIARHTETATATMVGAGAPAYMAPEQILGKDPVPQTDIYALGVVMYEMLSGGMRPFTGEFADTTGSITQKIAWEHLHANAHPLSEYNPGISDGLNAIVQKCLEKDPTDRFANPEELLAALQDADNFYASDPNEEEGIAIEEEEFSKIEKNNTSKIEEKKNQKDPNQYWPRIWVGILMICSIIAIIGSRVNARSLITQTSTPKPAATKRPATPTPRCALTSPYMNTWNTLICEDFSTLNEQFFTGIKSGDLGNVNVSIQNGKYIADLTGSAYSGYQGGIIQRFRAERSKDFVLSVDAEIESVFNQCGLGIAFRSTSDSFYFFRLQHDGFYTFQKLEHNKWTPLIGWRAHNGIKWDRSFNITIVAEGDQFDFYLDDVLVNSFYDDSLTGSGIDLVFTASEGASAALSFDNLLIKVP